MDSYVREIGERIKEMDIRGATEIAQSASLGMKTEAEKSIATTPQEFMAHMKEAALFLLNTRPTAVSLPNAIRYILSRLMSDYEKGIGIEALRRNAIANSERFISLSNAAIQTIGEIGARRIKEGDIIMTHCNSRCVISTLIEAHKGGKHFSVIACETRPRLQGHLTAKALRDAGIDVTLIVDSAARYFLDDVKKVVIGADSVAANGAVINKIGTSTIAALAHEARVRLMVAAETYKFHPGTMHGELVEIEERDAAEIIPDMRGFEGIRIRNPAFDITPPEYIDLIVTELGVIPPQAAVLVLKEQYGWEFSGKEPWE
jgi:ribose 1,5-bisphosphate isomerase